MFISRHLADNDRSFTITFHNSHVTLSFNIANCADDVEDGALWVRVGFLEGESLAAVKRSGKTLVLLEEIYLGTEVAVECGNKVSQAGFYIQWNEQLILIHYYC